MDDGKGWYGESRRHSEAALKNRSGIAPTERVGRGLYALTIKDVQWLGMAPAVIGGGITAWQDGEEGASDIVKKHTSRDFLGTSVGLSPVKRVPREIVLKIADEIEAQGREIGGAGRTVEMLRQRYQARSDQIRRMVH